METPEVHQPHPPRARRTRRHDGIPRWLELVIAVTALITSVSSIAIAIHHGDIMEKLVRANSIPYLQGGFSDVTLEGEQVLSMELLNRGVGPAHEQSLRIKVGERYAKSVDELVSASLGPETAARAKPLRDRIIKNRVPKRFIPGGETQVVFRVPRVAENAIFWDQLVGAQDRWNVEFCYCSVFDECWQVKGKWTEPEPVKQCHREEGREFFP